MANGEGNVRLALRIQGVIVLIEGFRDLTIITVDICIPGITTGTIDIRIPGITTDITGICIPGITTGTTGMRIPDLTGDIKDICTPGLAMGITGTEKIGKQSCNLIV
jgi:hypothetical protein